MVDLSCAYVYMGIREAAMAIAAIRRINLIILNTWVLDDDSQGTFFSKSSPRSSFPLGYSDPDAGFRAAILDDAGSTNWFRKAGRLERSTAGSVTLTMVTAECAGGATELRCDFPGEGPS